MAYCTVYTQCITLLFTAVDPEPRRQFVSFNLLCSSFLGKLKPFNLLLVEVLESPENVNCINSPFCIFLFLYIGSSQFKCTNVRIRSYTVYIIHYGSHMLVTCLIKSTEFQFLSLDCSLKLNPNSSQSTNV